MVDGEGSVLDGGAEGAAGVGAVVGVQVGEGGEGGDDVRRIGARLQHLLQLPAQARGQGHRHCSTSDRHSSS